MTAVESATGQKKFTYYVAVSRITGSKTAWEQDPGLRAAIGGNPIRILDLREMLTLIDNKLTTTLAGTEVGRTLQLFKAAGIPLSAP